MSRPAGPLVAVTISCLVAGLAYSGAVTSFALGVFVLPGVLLAVAATSAVTRFSAWGGLVAGGAIALVWGELVNLASGDVHGPAARSTFAAALFTAVAVAAAAGQAPACFLLGVVGVLVGALALGAGAEVGPVAVATTVVAVVALAVLGRAREGWTERPPGRLVVLLTALAIGLVVTGFVVGADRQISAEPGVLSPGAVDDSIKPPGLLELPTPTSTPSATRTQPSDTKSTAADGEPAEDSSSGTAQWLLAAMVLLVVAMLVRLMWVALEWRRLRRRLGRGSPADQVRGAWVWARRRIVASGLDLPSAVSPDSVADGRGLRVLPRTMRPPLASLARAAEAATFAPLAEPTTDEVAEAWAAADRVAREAVGSLNVGRRVLLALRPISSAPSRPARSSDDLVEMRS